MFYKSTRSFSLTYSLRLKRIRLSAWYINIKHHFKTKLYFLWYRQLNPHTSTNWEITPQWCTMNFLFMRTLHRSSLNLLVNPTTLWQIEYINPKRKCSRRHVYSLAAIVEAGNSLCRLHVLQLLLLVLVSTRTASKVCLRPLSVHLTLCIVSWLSLCQCV